MTSTDETPQSDILSPASATALPIDWWAQILGGHPTASFERSGRPDEMYVALPRVERATIVIDARSRHGIADAVGKAGQGIVRSLAGRVLRIPGVAGALPGKLILNSPEPTLRQHLSELTDVDARLASSCGPLRPNRKPVVRVLDDAGSLRSVAKVGWDDLTSRLVATEGAAIASFNEASTSTHIVTPKVLRHERWRGLELLVVSPLAIDAERAPEFSPAPTMQGLREIVSMHRTTADAVSACGFFERIHARLPQVELYNFASKTPIDIGGFHGDWSPWNTQPTQDGRLLVWDWERHATDVPVGLDLVHFLFQVERFIDNRSAAQARPAVIRRATEMLPELDVSGDLADLLVDLYLFEAIARNSEGALSSQLSTRRQGLVEALGPDAKDCKVALLEQLGDNVATTEKAA